MNKKIENRKKKKKKKKKKKERKKERFCFVKSFFLIDSSKIHPYTNTRTYSNSTLPNFQ